MGLARCGRAGPSWTWSRVGPARVRHAREAPQRNNDRETLRCPCTRPLARVLCRTHYTNTAVVAPTISPCCKISPLPHALLRTAPSRHALSLCALQRPTCATPLASLARAVLLPSAASSRPISRPRAAAYPQDHNGPAQPVRIMRCTPDAVSTTSLSCPSSSASTASSNSGCM